MLNYYTPYNDYFWNWEEEYQVVAIPKGNTIAYRPLVLDVVDALQMQGLPRFGTLLMAMAALTSNGHSRVEEISQKIRANPHLKIDSDDEESFSFLRRLASLPPMYKKGNKKILVLQAIFENTHKKASIKQSKLIARTGRNEIEDLIDKNPQGGFMHVWVADIRPLEIIARKFPTVESIIEAIANLPEIEKELELLPPVQQESLDSESYIESLENDPQTYKIGTLVKTIWAGLHLPYNSLTPSNQPIGGVADITNKGNLDQLLISEFANDDLVFLSRLANNEALFLSRETPPVKEDARRVLLIDVSLKNWGTPKLLSFATLLAIAFHPKTEIDCEAFVIGNTYKKVKFEHIDDLVTAIQEVESSINPATGLKNFFNNNNDSGVEYFLLTERSIPAQSAMMNTIQDYRQQLKYLILNDREGQIDVFQNKINQRKHIQRLVVPYQKLWNKKKQDFNKEIIETPSDFYPILLRPQIEPLKICVTDERETFMMTKDKTLLRFYDKKLPQNLGGWEVFHEGIAFGDYIYHIGRFTNDSFVLLTFNPKSKEVTLYNFYSKKKRTFFMKECKATSTLNFIFHNNHFYYKDFYKIYQITADGKFKEAEKHIHNIFEIKKKERNERVLQFRRTQPVFKNIKKAGINFNGQLMFNKHEFRLNSGNHFKLDVNNTAQNALKIEAFQKGKNLFMFRDGSSILIKPFGMIILSSSNKEIPDIFIPSALDVSLGVATRTAFAGNPFYYNAPLFEVRLLDYGEAILKTIKLIKDATGLSLKQCKELADTAPSILPYYFKQEDAESFVRKIKKLGGDGRITPVNPAYQFSKIIDNGSFYFKYVKAYIDHVMSNG